MSLYRLANIILIMTLSIFRLNGDRNGGAWCSASPVSRELGNNEWIQVDLGKIHVVTGVKTQGRLGKCKVAYYTKAYKLHYWRPGMTDFIEYHDSLGRTVCQNHTSKAFNIISYIVYYDLTYVRVVLDGSRTTLSS